MDDISSPEPQDKVVAIEDETTAINPKKLKSELYKSLALEYSSRNITINIIAPGFIESNMTDKLDENQKKSITDRIPISRLGTSKDVANGVLFLSSDDSSYITGQTFHINGGMLMV